MMASRSYKI